MQNVGVLSVESGDLQSSGLAPGQSQIGFSFSQSSVRIRELNHVPVSIGRVTQSVNLVGGLGLGRSASVWGQLPVVKIGKKGEWTLGDPALGVRLRSPWRSSSSVRSLFVNQGFVFPVGKFSTVGPGTENAVRDGTSGPLPGRGVYVSRTVAEMWDRASSERTFGLQMLLDFPLGTNDDGVRPGRLVQLSVHTIDHRFSKPGLVPFVSMTLRNQEADDLDGNSVLNSGGWFVYGIAALDIRISPDYSATASISAPWIVEIDGVKLSQMNLGLSVRRTSREP